MVLKPSFIQAWSKFNKVNVSVADVGKLIGGDVGINIDLGARDLRQGFTNVCAMKVKLIIDS